jgi:hypothetical protein
MDPVVVFSVPEQEEPAIEVRVNFGMFAGRSVTPAEIDELANALHDEVPAFAIVAEDRHEFADAVEASVHQVVVAVAPGDVVGEPDVVCRRILYVADAWAAACIADRHVEVG